MTHQKCPKPRSLLHSPNGQASGWAYKGCPVAPDHQRFTVVAVYNEETQRWEFFVYAGLLLGFESAVVSFNRYPVLTVAASRRILGTATAAHVDDVANVC